MAKRKIFAMAIIVAVKIKQSDMGPNFLSLYITLLNNVNKNLQQTTKQTEFSDEFLAGILRA